ncbi:hypothetical protein HZA33_00845 [Candidatus Pacearchaeota archaeon]|nr:hypothetical protein [Candidatus Pacearchaeota archaeon]
MSESGDYDPGPWRDRDFKKSKKDYDVHVGRSYDDAVSSGKKVSELVEKRLTTDSEYPLVIACDVTGSMGDWPATIFSKLPYLDIEGKEYLGKTMEISFAAIGDVYSDQYPLQVRPFTSGTNLEKRLKELVIEGNGGGQIKESYDLCALYYTKNVEMPKVKHKPVFIFIGDEGLYDFVNKSTARDVAGISLTEKLSTKDVIEELKKKYSVYLVSKPYGYETLKGDKLGEDTKTVHSQWVKYLGEDHIAMLPEAGRVVDVIFGILASETSKVDYFKEELTGRQKPHQVEQVLESLHPIHAEKKKK